MRQLLFAVIAVGMLGVANASPPQVSPPKVSPPKTAGLRRCFGPIPGIGFGKFDVKGGLATGLVRRYVKRYWSKLQSCYESAIAVKPGLRGSVGFKHTIGTDGHVWAASVSRIGELELESCIAGVLNGMEFPRPKTRQVTATSSLTLMPDIRDR
jgi:hypothetical protein